MRGLHNASARPGLAVDALSTSSKPLKERLTFAAFHIINDMKVDDLAPGDLRTEYERLEGSLTQMPPPPPSDGRIQATIRAMTDFEAEESARAILGLARRVEEAASHQSSPSALNDAARPRSSLRSFTVMTFVGLGDDRECY